jgi:Cu/Ag efflux protein CusF
MKTSLVFASVILVGSTAMAAQAPKSAAKTTAPKTSATKPAPAAHATGVIEKFDAATKTLTVKHDGKSMQFVLADSASLMMGKEKIDAAMLASHAGSQARIEYTTSGSSKLADKVEVAAMKSAKPAGKSEGTKKK